MQRKLCKAGYSLHLVTPLVSYNVSNHISVTCHPFAVAYLTCLASKLDLSINLCHGLLHAICHTSMITCLLKLNSLKILQSASRNNVNTGKQLVT